MKNIFRAIALLILSFSFSSMNVKEKDFHVFIEQNGEIIEPKNGTVSLDRSRFNLVFEFNKPMGLLINASFKEDTYKLATQGKPKSQLPGFQNTGMAEGLLNPNNEIFISDDAPSYWFYDDNEKNRFNTSEKVNDKIKCKRTIQNLFVIDTQGKIEIEDIKTPLYLVFISYKRGKDTTDEIELKREWIKIQWKK